MSVFITYLLKAHPWMDGREMTVGFRTRAEADEWMARVPSLNLISIEVTA